MAYEGGYSSAVNQGSEMHSRAVLDQQRQQQMAIAALAMQQQQRQQQARQQLGPILEMFAGRGGAQAPQPPMVPPGLPPPPGTAAGGPMPPGVGQSSAPPQPPGPAMPPQPGMGMPPPPTMQAGAPPQARAPMPAPAAGQAPIQIPPFRSMPTAPPPGAAPGAIPPPPAGPPPAAAPPDVEPKPINLGAVIEGFKKAGVPPDRWMDMLDELQPVMNAQNKHELDFFKANNAALKAANDIYLKTLQTGLKGKEVEIKGAAEDRRGRQGDRNLDIKQQKEDRLRSSAAKAAGGTGNLKTTELIYPKGEDGRPDETKAPIGVRGITKTGKIVTLDADGKPVTAGELSGGTAKEAKDTKTSGQATVRASLVKSGVTNSLARLKEIEDKHPAGSTSSFFGQHGDNPMTRGVYGAARSLQGGKQQDIDAKWASMIDEAIPVFTGGLRGSDAFRRFLIEQAPGPGDKPATITEKMRLFRENIQGTSKAFFGKFQSDPKMWAEGTKPEEVKGASPAAAPGKFTEGQTATNDKNEQIVYRNGKWQPVK